MILDFLFLCAVSREYVRAHGLLGFVSKSFSRVPSGCRLLKFTFFFAQIPVLVLMMYAYAQQAEKLAPCINQMIEDFEAGPTGAIQSFGFELKQKLVEHNMGYREVVHHSHVGVDIDNREGEMLFLVKVHQLLAQINGKGWDASQTASALAREISQNGVIRELQLSRNQELIQRADGLLAPIQPELLRVVTGAGSHTTAVLKLISAADTSRVPDCTDVDEHLAVNGFLCKARILKHCPSFAAPLQTGIEYFIVRWQLADKCPSLMRILSESDNAKHDNYQKEFVIQTMFNLHRRAVEAHAECDDDFKAVAKRVTRGHGPSFARNVECYTDFVRQHSGGPTMPLLVELHEFIKTLKVEREVPPEF